MSKKFYPVVLSVLALFSVSSLYSQNSARVANRRTASRYMQLAKQYASEKQWSEAESNARIGLAYDDSIADLWYLCSVSKMNLGHKKSEILPLVVRSLGNGEWVDYNRDGARILYADILTTTKNYEKALSVLDAEPFIYSADAEFIRSKCYYNLRTPESIEKARNKIDAARRVYPLDTRFPEYFYHFEYMLYQEKGQIDARAQKLADAFLASLPMYKKADSELELYAALFVSDKEKKIRNLKAFSAKNNKSPLYPAAALEAGLMSEQNALDYFYSFSDNYINLSVLEAFSKTLKKEETIKEFGEYLNSYNGTIFIDVDKDLITNMTVTYNRGRASSVFYDENQDDDFEWSCDCDFGVPVAVTLGDKSVVTYGNWPYIQNAVYRNVYAGTEIKFDLIAETLAWTPFVEKADEAVKNSIKSDFFIPVLNHAQNSYITPDDFVNSALSYTMPSSEKKDAVITVNLLNGLAQLATYSAGDRVYAVAKFENGLPVVRNVDMDGDGMFETIEEYGFTKDLSLKFISKSDEMQVITNLFGSPASGTGIYVKSITIDRNGDTIPDFTEEYTAGEGKISSWDSDSDGKWDVRYTRHPVMKDGKLRESAQFYQPLTHNVITVSSENGVPVNVMDGNKYLEVVKGASKNFYWISASAGKTAEEIIKNKINQTADQGVSIIVEDKIQRYLAVRIEDKIFAEVLPSSVLKK